MRSSGSLRNSACWHRKCGNNAAADKEEQLVAAVPETATVLEKEAQSKPGRRGVDSITITLYINTIISVN